MLTNIDTKSESSTLGRLAKSIKVFIPGKYQKIVGDIPTTSNGTYRLGDVLKGFDDARKLSKLPKHEGSVANIYTKHCESCRRIHDIEAFEEILRSKQRNYRAEDTSDACVMMLRIGDRLGLPAKFAIIRDQLIQTVAYQMNKVGVSKLIIVTSVHMGNMRKGARIDRNVLNVNINAIIELIEGLEDNGITDVEFRGSPDADEDLKFCLSAKNIILTKGGYGEIVEMFGQYETIMNIANFRDWFALTHPVAKPLGVQGGHYGSNVRYRKCIVVVGDEFYNSMYAMYDIAKKIFPEFKISSIENGFASIGTDTCLVYCNHENSHRAVELARIYSGDCTVYVFSNTPGQNRLMQFRNFIQSVQLQDPYVEMFKGLPYIFIKTPRTAGTSIAGAIRDNIAVPVDGYWPHIPAYRYWEEYNNQIFNSKYSFGFIRNPVERLVSAYHHIKRLISDADAKYYAEKARAIKMCATETFEEFVDVLYDNFHFISKHECTLLPQSFYLCNPNGGQLVTEIFPFEHLQESWEVLKDKIGLKGELPHLKGDPEQFDKDVDDLSEEVAEKILEMYAFDSQMHNKCLREFKKNYTAARSLKELL